MKKINLLLSVLVLALSSQLFANVKGYNGFNGYSDLTNTGVKLMWDAQSNAATYNIFTVNSDGTLVLVDAIKAPQLEYYVTNLQVGTTYEFKLIVLQTNGRLNKPNNNLVITTLSEPVPVSCPANYVQVPANVELGIYRDFCVMKYEAKEGPSGEAISSPDNASWNLLTIVEAKNLCQSIGTGYDLISNQEWMVIAREIENFGANWNSGIVGEGCLSRGNSGADNLCGYYHDAIDFGSVRDLRAQSHFSNGESIWDFTGNLWEWVDWEIGGGLDLAPVSCPAGWREISEVGCSAISKDNFAPITDGLDSIHNGVGRFFGGTGGAAARGGAWSSTINSGLYALYLKNTPASSRKSVGFRCVYRP